MGLEIGSENYSKFFKIELPKSVKGLINEILRTLCWVLTGAWHHAMYFLFIAFKSLSSKR